MPIVVQCKHCQEKWDIPSQYAGQPTTCPACEATVRVPDITPSESATKYCRSCGGEVHENATDCKWCHVSPKKGYAYCYHCGEETRPEAVVCADCGVALPSSAKGSDSGTEASHHVVSSDPFGDHVNFRTFLAPLYIKISYVLLTILVVVGWLVGTIFAFKHREETGIAVLFGGFPLCVYIWLQTRIWCEWLIVSFRMYEELREFRSDFKTYVKFRDQKE